MKKHEDNTIIVIIVLALLLVFGFGWGSCYMGGMMFFGPLFMVAVLVLIIWLTVSLIQKG